MASEIERITNTFLSNPARIEVARQATASETIEQGVVMFKGSRKDRADSEKRKLLRALIDAEGAACSNAIIFCNRKTDVDAVAKSLKKYGYDAAPIHGDLDQSQRTRTLDGFREGSIRLLVASDVAARGLDIPAVSHVFNFDVPSHAEDYVHRIGRTGRAGRSGKAVMICGPRDDKYFEAVEKLLEKEIPRLETPLAGGKPEPDQADAPAGEKPKRSRTRSRKKADTPKADAAAPAPEAEPDDTAAAKPAPKTEKKPDSRAKGGRGRAPRDEAVVGMGDDAPDFIVKSFDERRAG
jgi:ATP-dependent RNA helicase RhlE